MTRPALSDLDAFAAVAAARSFRGAAILRGVSASGLSEAVRRLEAALDVRLLHRTTRSVTPTVEGQRLLDRAGPALGEIEAALDGVGRDGALTGTLRLNVPVVVARVVLPHIVPGFLAAHPGVRLEITADNRFIDVLGAGFDAGIRYDERVDKDMIAVPIGPRTQRYVLAGAPAYFERAGRPDHPRALVDHACIRHRFVSGVSTPWTFERGDETVQVDPDGPLATNQIDVQIAAATAGLGLIMSFEEFLADALARGALVEILDDWSPVFSGPRLYFSSRRHMPPPLRAFVDYVRALGAPVSRQR